MCDGVWSSFPREIETETEDPILINRCSGCSELLVVFRYRRYTVPDASTNEEILRIVLTEYLEAKFNANA